jgi:hypothetical protein
MKYIAFILMACVGIPYMIGAASKSARVRDNLVTALIVLTSVGGMTKMNFVSMEHYRGPDRGFEVTLTDLIVVSLITVMRTRFRSKTVTVPFNTGWLASLYFVVCYSFFFAPLKLMAAFSIWKYLRMAALYWCMVNILRIGVSTLAVWRGLLGAGFYVAFMALKEKFINHVYRVPGPFDHSNTVPLYCNLLMPCLLMWGLCDKRLTERQAMLSVGTSFAIIVSIVFTYSRAGLMFSLIAMVLTMVVANVRMPWRRVKKVTKFLLVAGVIAGAAVAPSVIDRINNAPESSEEARQEFNNAAAAMLADNPLGVGINNFPEVLTEDPQYNKFLDVMSNEDSAGVCHHIYRLTAAELGWPGLILFVIIILRFAGRAFFAAIRNKSLEGNLLLGLFFGAIALHASGFLEWVFRITPVMSMYVITSGFIVALAAKATARPAPAPPPAAAPSEMVGAPA